MQLKACLSNYSQKILLSVATNRSFAQSAEFQKLKKDVKVKQNKNLVINPEKNCFILLEENKTFSAELNKNDQMDYQELDPQFPSTGVQKMELFQNAQLFLVENYMWSYARFGTICTI